ncbi:MAG: hypothetical protein F4Y48_01255 [Gammaproteobacteria bacterium]|nr:hypothetical protein [Gammaproteobacteria bacterium]
MTRCGPGRPQLQTTTLGRYSFRHLKPGMRHGYRLLELVGEQEAFVATPEKAFLDLAYLQPGGDDRAWIDGLRLNVDALCGESLESMAAATRSPKLMRAARCVRSLENDSELVFETV